MRARVHCPAAWKSRKASVFLLENMHRRPALCRLCFAGQLRRLGLFIAKLIGLAGFAGQFVTGRVDASRLTSSPKLAPG